MEDRTETPDLSDASPDAPTVKKKQAYLQLSLLGALLSLLLINGFFWSLTIDVLLDTSIGIVQFSRFAYHSYLFMLPLQIAGVVFGMLGAPARKTPGLRVIFSVFIGGILMLLWFSFAFCGNARRFFTYSGPVHYKTNKCLVKVACAVEQYALDRGEYPPALAPFLTTPTPYLRRIPRDPYGPIGWPPLEYESDGRRWILLSRGPNARIDFPISEWRTTDREGVESLYTAYSYEPTNGTRSGDFILTDMHRKIRHLDRNNYSRSSPRAGEQATNTPAPSDPDPVRAASPVSN